MACISRTSVSFLFCFFIYSPSLYSGARTKKKIQNTEEVVAAEINIFKEKYDFRVSFLYF